MNGAAILLIETMAFFSVATIVFGAERWLGAFLVLRRRLGAARVDDRGKMGPVFKDRTPNNRFLAWVEGATLSESRETNKLRRDLSEAGFQSPTAPIYFVIVRFFLAIGVPVAFIFAQQFSARPATGLALIVLSVTLSAVGLFAPGAFIGNRATARRTQLENEFPDALDLMVVCVEAGLGLEAAFVRVADEIQESRPLIADSLHRVSVEWQAGRSRADALRGMAERVRVENLKAFAALLIQTDALGTSISQTLRTFSMEMRESRFHKAEEKAMRIPVLMTIPLVVCILPVIITALMLPAIIDVMRTLQPLLKGGVSG